MCHVGVAEDAAESQVVVVADDRRPHRLADVFATEYAAAREARTAQHTPEAGDTHSRPDAVGMPRRFQSSAIAAGLHQRTLEPLPRE